MHGPTSPATHCLARLDAESQTAEPVAGPTPLMCYGHDDKFLWPNPVHEIERKAPGEDSAGARQVCTPDLWVGCNLT